MWPNESPLFPDSEKKDWLSFYGLLRQYGPSGSAGPYMVCPSPGTGGTGVGTGRQPQPQQPQPRPVPQCRMVRGGGIFREGPFIFRNPSRWDTEWPRRLQLQSGQWVTILETLPPMRHNPQNGPPWISWVWFSSHEGASSVRSGENQPWHRGPVRGYYVQNDALVGRQFDCRNVHNYISRSGGLRSSSPPTPSALDL
jgi:hypothetical protein